MKQTHKYVVMKMVTVTTILAPTATQSMQTMVQIGCSVHCAPNGSMKFAFICDNTHDEGHWLLSLNLCLIKSFPWTF